MSYILLHDPGNKASVEFLPLFGTLGQVITGHDECVAAMPNFQGYPTVVYTDANGQKHALYSPADMDAVTAWQTVVDTLPAKRILSQYEFTQLFTATERKAIRQQSKSNTDLEDLMEVLKSTQEVNLDFQILIEGLAFLVSLGILTSERRDQILAGEAP